MQQGVFTPYCGAPPIPGGLSWNLDPVLLLILLFGCGLYFIFIRTRFFQISRSQLLMGGAGWTVLFAAFITPICNLSVALFAARSAQHLLVTLVAAPLLILGGLDRFAAAKPPGRSERACAAVLFAVVLWFWHMPTFYDATLRDNFTYWTMHITLASSALWLWRALLRGENGLGTSLLMSLATGAQTCALGALLTLSPRPWFAVHRDTTWPWGLSQLADQQLGGAIMWIVGSTILGGLTVFVFARGFLSLRPSVSTVFSQGAYFEGPRAGRL